MKHFSIIAFLFFCLSQNLFSQQYDENFVMFSKTSFQGDDIGCVDLSRDGNHVKVKYFAGRDKNGTLVSERYRQWSKNKRVIAFSSGTYMTNWNPQTAAPVGLCIDNGDLINNQFVTDRFHGLAVVYATGGVAVSNLKDKNFKVTNADGTSEQLDITNSFQRTKFIKWAESNDATVFQTHLFYYKDKYLVNDLATNKAAAERRFLAVGYDENRVIHHYIVNIKQGYDIYTATVKAVEFLKDRKDVKELVYVINLDTGGQNVFGCYKKDGSLDGRPIFSGGTPLDAACNLLVYYYE